MVSASICEHASTAFYFASTSNGRIRLASSEHSRIMQLASSEHLVNSPLAAIPFFKFRHTLYSGVYCFNLHIASIALRITHMLTFFVAQLFLYHKTTKNNLRAFEQSSKFQRESEPASNCKNFVSKSKRALV